MNGEKARKTAEVREAATQLTHSRLVQINIGQVSKLAGGFKEWLRNAEASLRSEPGASNVPCETCTACCRSSMFVHIRPEEIQTLRRIPRKLLFPAPGLPKGHLVMGYNDKGHCPMLIDNKCSIYEDRPRTCREYDCRIFAATGIAIDEQTQKDIAERVAFWTFSYEGEESEAEQEILKDAATFLIRNRELFPLGSVPKQPGPLAALAIRIHRIFAELTARMRSDGRDTSDAEIAHAITAALRQPNNREVANTRDEMSAPSRKGSRTRVHSKR